MCAPCCGPCPPLPGSNLSDTEMIKAALAWAHAQPLAEGRRAAQGRCQRRAPVLAPAQGERVLASALAAASRPRRPSACTGRGRRAGAAPLGVSTRQAHPPLPHQAPPSPPSLPLPAPPPPVPPGFVVLTLPPGRFELSERIYLNRSRLVLRGAGRVRTRLYVPHSLTDLYGPSHEGAGGYVHFGGWACVAVCVCGGGGGGGWWWGVVGGGGGGGGACATFLSY